MGMQENFLCPLFFRACVACGVAMVYNGGSEGSVNTSDGETFNVCTELFLVVNSVCAGVVIHELSRI